MTNPNNAVGTNGAFGGRTSVNAFNDVLALVSKGVVSGWACSPSSGMTVQLGGVAGTRDVAVAEDNAGNKTTVNNISGSPIEVTIANASTTDNMIDYIVAYVSNPPSGDEDVADNPSACGIISVRGASANTAPTASAIRSAITADGGTGTLAYYVVLAQISVTAGLTTITNDNISAVDVSGVGSNNIDFTTTTTTVPASGFGNTGVWTKRIIGGAIFYSIFMGAANSLSISGNSWQSNFTGLDLPDNLSYDPTKMLISCLPISTDGAVMLSPHIETGQSRIAFSAVNHYSSQVVTYPGASVSIVVFPE